MSLTFNIRSFVTGIIFLLVGGIWNYYTSIDSMWYVLQKFFVGLITYETGPLYLETNVCSWYIMTIGVSMIIISFVQLDLDKEGKNT